MIGALLMFASFVISVWSWLAGTHPYVMRSGETAINRRELVCERLGRLAAVSGLREKAERSQRIAALSLLSYRPARFRHRIRSTSLRHLMSALREPSNQSLQSTTG
jgi:hypothetical protein